MCLLSEEAISLRGPERRRHAQVRIEVEGRYLLALLDARGGSDRFCFRGVPTPGVFYKVFVRLGECFIEVRSTTSGIFNEVDVRLGAVKGRCLVTVASCGVCDRCFGLMKRPVLAESASVS